MNRRQINIGRCPECGRRYGAADSETKKESGPASIRVSTLAICALLYGLYWVLTQMANAPQTQWPMAR